MADDPTPGSMYIENEDGSLDRLGEVPEEIRKLAEEKGRVITPDHIPADEVGKWFPYMVPKPPAADADLSPPPVRDRRVVRWRRRKY